MKGRCRYAGVELPVDLAELHSTQYLAEAEDAEETMKADGRWGGAEDLANVPSESRQMDRVTMES